MNSNWTTASAVIITALVVIGFFAVTGAQIVIPHSENAVVNVSQEKIYVTVTVTPSPTMVPVTPVTHPRIVNPVPTEVPKVRPVLLVDNVAPEIKWSDMKGSISKEDIAFWFGKENQDWKGNYKEIVFQLISSYVKEYRQRVFVKSAKFSKMIYSDSKGAIHVAEDVTFGDLSEEKDVIAYTLSIRDPNDAQKRIKMLFFYDSKNEDIVAFGSGDSAQIVTKPNFVIGSSDSAEGSYDGGSTDVNGGGSGGGGDSGGPVGGVGA